VAARSRRGFNSRIDLAAAGNKVALKPAVEIRYPIRDYAADLQIAWATARHPLVRKIGSGYTAIERGLLGI